MISPTKQAIQLMISLTKQAFQLMISPTNQAIQLILLTLLYITKLRATVQ
jgi:hypothetical protein